MKTVRLFALVLLTLVLLTACGGAAPEAEKTGPAGTSSALPAETAPEAESPERDPRIPQIQSPTKKSDFEALPVANAAMTTDELRRIAVEYYRMMANIRWTLSEDLDYDYPSASTSDRTGKLHLKKYVKYGGMPYTKASGGLADFLDFYDDETGILDVTTYGAATAERLGNNCATSVFWAWARVSGTVDYTGTETMTVKNGCLRVGPYTYDDSISNFTGSNSTRAICDRNGREVMYESYAMLLPADGTVKYVDGGAHHARMVQEAAVVVRDPDGTVNGEESYVVFFEQDSSPRADDTPEDGSVQFITVRRSQYSFAKLFDEASIPLRPAELDGTRKVEKAAVSLSGEAADLSALSALTLTANYPVSRVSFTLTDGEGKEVYSTASYSEAYATKYTFALNRVVRASSVKRNLESGKTYSAEILVRLGNGETLPVWAGEVTG